MVGGIVRMLLNAVITLILLYFVLMAARKWNVPGIKNISLA